MLCYKQHLFLTQVSQVSVDRSLCEAVYSVSSDAPCTGTLIVPQLYNAGIVSTSNRKPMLDHYLYRFYVQSWNNTGKAGIRYLTNGGPIIEGRFGTSRNIKGRTSQNVALPYVNKVRALTGLLVGDVRGLTPDDTTQYECKMQTQKTTPRSAALDTLFDLGQTIRFTLQWIPSLSYTMKLFTPSIFLRPLSLYNSRFAGFYLLAKL